MRYFSYNEYVHDSAGYVVTLSEKQIHDDYYLKYWLPKMKERFGDSKDISFEACLDDWIVVNWAWENKDVVPG